MSFSSFASIVKSEVEIALSLKKFYKSLFWIFSKIL